ncbi:hypothetical protein GSS88_00810 [Corynebacterium sp. 3HC-13]|nr:hypothetical protein [Corynebacterium poyangense]MBZ8176347.1 hypothetical protein [Corynebacterium poyangense]
MKTPPSPGILYQYSGWWRGWNKSVGVVGVLSSSWLANSVAVLEEQVYK